MQGFFDLINCDFKSNCENTNTVSCNNCIRNKKTLVDNFQLKNQNGVFLGSKGNVCEGCSNNPRNGGTGNCNCTLNLPQIT